MKALSYVGIERITLCKFENYRLGRKFTLLCVQVFSNYRLFFIKKISLYYVMILQLVVKSQGKLKQRNRIIII